MNRGILFPFVIAASVISICVKYSLEGWATYKKADGANRAAQISLDRARQSNTRLTAQIGDAHADLFQAKEFLAEWETCQTRSLHGGVDSCIQELATGFGVVSPSPVIAPASKYLDFSGGKISATQVSVKGEGSLSSIVRYYAEIERALPTAHVRSVVIRSGDREPRIETEMAILERNFSEMPPLPSRISQKAGPPPDSYAKRPDVRHTAVPSFSDTLIARGSRGGSTDIPRPTELNQHMPDLKASGVIWSADPSRRILLANGLLLRAGHPVPRSLIKSKAKITLQEIGRDFARFQIVTEEMNPATGRPDKVVSEQEYHFAIFEDIQPEG